MNIPKTFASSRLPVVAAPMFLVSGDRLTIEACKAGISATFPALNQRSTEEFEKWVVKIKSELEAFKKANPTKPVGTWGVNLIVHKSNPRLQADLEICIKHQVPLIITSLGAVKELVSQVQSYGGVVFHDVTNPVHGKKAADAGVDGLIAVCAGAGGHAGTTNPFALVSELRSFFKKTLILAGGISTGRDIAAALMMGADLAYMGTRFIATQESQAPEEYKQMLLEARSSDIIHTPAVSGVPANFMRQSLEKNGFDMKRLFDHGDVNFGEKLTLDNEAKAWKNIWSAGHGVSAIHDVPAVHDLVNRLHDEYSQAIKEFEDKIRAF